jgi:hypothetical protein
MGVGGRRTNEPGDQIDECAVMEGSPENLERRLYYTPSLSFNENSNNRRARRL